MSQIVTIPYIVGVGTFLVARVALKAMVGAVELAAEGAVAMAEATRDQDQDVDRALAGDATKEHGTPAFRLRVLDTKMQERDTLVQALWDVGFVSAETTDPPASIQGRFHRGGAIPGKREGRRDLALTVADPTGQFLFALEPGPEGLRALCAGEAGQLALQQVAQRYAYLQALGSAQEQGFHVVAEARERPDGSVETLLRRTSSTKGTQEIRLLYQQGEEGSFVQLDSQGRGPDGSEACPNLDPFLAALGAKDAQVKPKPPQARRGMSGRSIRRHRPRRVDREHGRRS